MGPAKQSPTLDDLPAPPPGKAGWPWYVDPIPLPRQGEWPQISIVTPSLNQTEFIEETIRSVLLQGYPKLQYIIIDGGSTDGTIEIIRKYEAWLSDWVSEPDAGQPNAINKGLCLATGTLFGFINSDDLLLPGALIGAGIAHTEHPSKLIAGDVLEFRSSRDDVQRIHQYALNFPTFVQVWKQVEWHQPGIFIPLRP